MDRRLKCVWEGDGRDVDGREEEARRQAGGGQADGLRLSRVWLIWVRVGPDVPGRGEGWPVVLAARMTPLRAHRIRSPSCCLSS